MKPFNPGDYVAVLNEAIAGTVIHSDKFKTKIKDLDGFVREYKNELLVIAKAEDQYRLIDDPLDKDTVRTRHKSKPKKAQVVSNVPLEIDLHFEALKNNLSFTDPNQILQKQMTACKSFIKKALDKKAKRIVLIHGKGEGILKAEIHLYLNKLKTEMAINLSYHDAPYTDYGMGGATEVLFG
jgi:hypothetical protein